MPDFHLSLSGSGLLLMLLMLILAGYSVFIYRRTNPPVSKQLRYFLLGLRVMALTIILFLFFEPILSLSWNRTQKPVLGILIDTSASMGLTDAKGLRSDEAKRVLSEPLFKKLADSYQLEYYQFSDKLTDLKEVRPESLKFAGDGTDIQAALAALKDKMAEKYFAGVILISDGADNLGENPARYAEAYDVPIFPVAIGDPTEQKDVLLSKVITNEVTYANNRVPVEVTVRSSGFEEVKIPVMLKQGGVTLDTQYLRLSSGGLESKVQLHYIPQMEGSIKYQVEVPQLEGELTALNNTRSFYVKVLKSRIKILLVAGGPSADFSFIKRALERDENIQVDCFVQKKGGSFYQGPFPLDEKRLSQYDCLVLVDFPRRDSLTRIVEVLKTLLQKGEKPLLFLAGKGTDFGELAALAEFLPIQLRFVKTNERLVYVTLSELGLIHPLVRFSDDVIENAARWRDLPPLFYSWLNLRLVEGAQALVYVDKERSGLPASLPDQPVVAVRKAAAQKSVAIMAYGLWRWDLLMWGIGKDNQDFQRFLGNTIRWLITKEDSRLVRISPDKEIYRSGEPIGFTAQIYYEDYRPLDGAEVKVTVQGKSRTHELVLSGIGEGKYEGSLQVLEGGDYTYSGQAVFKERELGQDAGKFSVEPFKLEFQDTRMKEELLKKIATASGGRYFSSHALDSLTQVINFPARNIRESQQWEIWNKTYLLVAFISLLSIEWLVRKKKGML
ncbi:MAG: VWA domain-containing protein [candidate division KSB1 bacterium]|nr:VWA domain-containing protein [candidate division KSB1 bacterium]